MMQHLWLVVKHVQKRNLVTATIIINLDLEYLAQISNVFFLEQKWSKKFVFAMQLGLGLLLTGCCQVV